ncbi:MAG: PQQ-dependent sugar dehydrogenase [Bacteroidota bacterium]
MNRLLLLSAILILGCSCTVSVVAQPFRVDTVARAPYAQYPVSIDFAADGSGKIFFTEKKTGRLRIHDGSLIPEPFLVVPVESDGEQGFLGLAVHPSYPDSPYIYVYYTRSIDRSNVVERYQDSSGVGIRPRPLLIVPRLDDGDENNGGTMGFGPDGKLYIAVGDYGTHPENAQDLTTRRNYRGKILRLNDDGSVPDDNPFPDSPIWSYGHRNPTGLAFDAATGLLYCTESGQGGRNEINVVTKGANLGWPDAARDKDQRIFSFTGRELPDLTGIVLYQGEAFPRLQGKFLFGGTAHRSLMKGEYTPEGDSMVVEEFFTTNAGFADVEVDPGGNIYLVNGPYISSRILRLVPVKPEFTSIPLERAWQDTLYEYTPEFTGTPPRLSIVSGPEGMKIDSAGLGVQWVPSNDQALDGTHMVTLRGENGAGYADQTFPVEVINVNDPPAGFGLLNPSNEELITLEDYPSGVLFTWEQAEDPDGDSIQYIFELDTLHTFRLPLRQDTLSGDTDSIRVRLPDGAMNYYWRVWATDGKITLLSTPDVRLVTADVLLPVLAAAELEEDADPESILEQNFPNPFNPTTSIQYTVPREGRVRLSVYNLLGQEVAVIFDGTQSEGIYSVEFDKADLPSGIYFYRIHGPGFFETKKMVIAK